jgi:hypothetical protein
MKVITMLMMPMTIVQIFKQAILYFLLMATGQTMRVLVVFVNNN